MVTVQVTRTYLEMTRPDELRPARTTDPGVRVERAVECPPSFYRYLYREVGRPHHWVDRLRWTEKDLRNHLARPDISVWILYHDRAPAGYFELQKHGDGSTQITYLGLLPEFIGRGLGGPLTTAAAEQAWATGAARVWLQTCTLDHPAAMPSYRACGFRPFKTEACEVTIAEDEASRR